MVSRAEWRVATWTRSSCRERARRTLSGSGSESEYGQLGLLRGFQCRLACRYEESLNES